jgi:hypothetical protein
MQRAFCNVLTDADAREAYLANPTAYLSTYDLDSRESRALTSVDSSRLRIYARMLVSARMDLGLKAFPNVRTLLPPDFIGRYGPRYSREFPRTVEHDTGALAREVRRLVQFFERLAEEGELAADGFLDAMHYDAIRYSLANDPVISAAIVEFERRALPPAGETVLKAYVLRAPGAVVREFAHDVLDMSSGRAGVARARETTPILVLFHKQSTSRHVRMFRINALTNRFLESCDGQHTIQEAARLVAETQRSDLGDCVQLGLRLASQRVIGAISDAPEGAVS